LGVEESLFPLRLFNGTQYPIDPSLEGGPEMSLKEALRELVDREPMDIDVLFVDWER